MNNNNNDMNKQQQVDSKDETTKLVIDTNKMLWQSFELEHFEMDHDLTEKDWAEFIQASRRAFEYETRALVETMLEDWMSERKED
jgi:hypothetical protein